MKMVKRLKKADHFYVKQIKSQSILFLVYLVYFVRRWSTWSTLVTRGLLGLLQKITNEKAHHFSNELPKFILK
jgi:hypothetical protein